MRQEVTEEGSLPPTLHQEATTGSIVNHSLQLRATGANTCHGRPSKSQTASPSQLDQNMLSLGRALYIRAECSFLKLHPSQREVFKSELVIAVVKVLDPILWSTLHFSTPLRPNHRRHTFTTAATVCLGCGLSLNVHSETYQRIGL